jgi:hypothetical protein
MRPKVCGESHILPYLLVLSNRGPRWRQIFMTSFKVYIDDSGTDPSQQVAIASCVVVPGTRTDALESEWNGLRKKESFTDFHASECIARNAESDFADWDDDKVIRVISRVRQIAKQFGVKAYSFSVSKADYDQIVPEKIKRFSGRYHYTWAVQNVFAWLNHWAQLSNITFPFEYVFDWMGKGKAKREVLSLMDRLEELAPGEGLPSGWYVNHSFRRREGIPALQFTDVLAWSSYQAALKFFKNIPPHPIALESYTDFRNYQNHTWFVPVTIKRDDLKDWVDRILKDGTALSKFIAWDTLREAKGKRSRP